MKVALVLLPGMDGTGLLFPDFITALGQDIEAIVVSYPQDKTLSYVELKKLVRSFLPVNKPYFILGESFSGPIAISIAATMPTGFLGLILCCTFAKNPLPLLKVARPLMALLPVTATPLSLLNYFLMGRFSTPELRSSLGRAVAAVSPAVLKNRACEVLSVDVSVALSTIKVPVLYLRSSEDRVVQKSSSELIATLAPQTQIVDFVAPHFLLQVLPCESASVVTNFIHTGSGTQPMDTSISRS